jgi:hypothetical protein
MPRRSSSRQSIRPFSSMPRHRRRSLVIRLQGRMLRNAHYTGFDRFTLWNAAFITTDMAKSDLASEQAYEQISAKLAAANEKYETRWTKHLIPRKRAGEQRMYRIEFAPEKHYDCLDRQTYSQAREALK